MLRSSYLRRRRRYRRIRRPRGALANAIRVMIFLCIFLGIANVAVFVYSIIKNRGNDQHTLVTAENRSTETGSLTAAGDNISSNVNTESGAIKKAANETEAKKEIASKKADDTPNNTIIPSNDVLSQTNSKEQPSADNNQNTASATNEALPQVSKTGDMEIEPPFEEYGHLEPLSTGDAVVTNVDLSKACFIGDSRTDGLFLLGNLYDSDFFCDTGLTLKYVLTKEFVKQEDGSKTTLINVLGKKAYDMVYVMFGVNELGYPYQWEFQKYYTDLITNIRTALPNADIIIQLVFPVTKERSDADEIFNIDKVRLINQTIVHVVNQMRARDPKLYCMDVSSFCTNEQGFLNDDASEDGIHLKQSYCIKWSEFLRTHYPVAR